MRLMKWTIAAVLLGSLSLDFKAHSTPPGKFRLPSKTDAMGERALSSGAPESAAQIYEAGLKRRPNSKRFLLGLIRAKAQMNDCAEAERLLLPKQHTRVANRQSLEELAACFSRFGAYSDAVYWQQERMYLAPPTPEGFATLATYQLGAGDWGAAMEALDQAVLLDPLHPSVFQTKLQLAIGAGEISETAQLFEEWDRAHPERSQLNWYLRARWALDVGDFDGAMETSLQCVKMSLHFSPVRVLRAEMFRRLGLLENAEEAVNTIYRLDVGKVGIEAVKVRILVDLERFDEARLLLKELESSAPLRPDVVASAWYLAFHEGNTAEVEQRSEMYELLQSNPLRDLDRLFPIVSKRGRP